MVYFISTQVRRYTAETTTLSAELEPGEEKCIIITLKERGFTCGFGGIGQTLVLL